METMDLSGVWGFQLNAAKQGEACFCTGALQDEIILPSTTAASKKGEPNKKKELGCLTEAYQFEGEAWYSKIIELPEAVLRMKNKKVIFFMERTRKTKVWIDGQEVGCKLSFCAPQVYDLTPYLTQAKHRLTVSVSNVAYPIPGGHMTSPDTQTNWNGILGEISLKIYQEFQIKEVQLLPSIAQKEVQALVKVENLGEAVEARLSLAVSCKKQEALETQGVNSIRQQDLRKQQTWQVFLKPGLNELSLSYKMQEPLLLWDEYAPHLYEAQVEVVSQEGCDQQTLSFGFREFKAGPVNFMINGEKTFLRGKHEGMIFPLTAYAPMDKAAWLKVFGIAKAYGINHYRFHTCCPPEAAFEAADECGMYLQPELPFWGSILAPGDEHYHPAAHEFLVEEGYGILRSFGNHPSFVMMSMGNELWGSKAVISQMVKAYKQADPRHLYTQGSNNFQFYPTEEPEDDFFSGVRFSKNRLIRGSYAMCDAPQGHIQVMAPNTTYNYDEMIRPGKALGIVENQVEPQVKGEINAGQGLGKASPTGQQPPMQTIEIQFGTGTKKVTTMKAEEMMPKVPVVSHEIGQYEVFPNFHEIEKYTGVLKPRNLEVFKERLKAKGLLNQANDFFQASGHLAAQCYQMELETAFRTKELAGFQLLDLQDFSGQGTALVGMLDAFLDNKGLVSEEVWRSFCSDAVLLLELPKFVFEAGEELKGKLKLCYYRPEPLLNKKLKWQLFQGSNCLKEQVVELKSIVERGLIELAELSLKLPQVKAPELFSLRLELMETAIAKTYELWVFPGQCPKLEASEVVVAETVEDAAKALAQGKKVLFFPGEGQNPKAIKGTYCTDFWCYPMFRRISENAKKEIPIGTMGLLIQKDHAALKDFACETYTTPPWWSIVEASALTILDETQLKPIVQMVDNFERNHRLGMIFEAQVGIGQLLVCTAAIQQEKDLPQKWLNYSLRQYMNSVKFKPSETLSLETFKKIFTI